MFLEAATRISNMLHAWNMNLTNEAKYALEVANVLTIGGIRVEGGDAPLFDRTNARRTMTMTFTVVGFVAHPE